MIHFIILTTWKLLSSDSHPIPKSSFIHSYPFQFCLSRLNYFHGFSPSPPLSLSLSLSLILSLSSLKGIVREVE